MKRAEAAKTLRYEVSGRSIALFAGSLVAIWLFTEIWPVLLVLLVALILVGTLNPFARFLQSRGFSRQLAVLTIFALLIVCLALLLLLGVPALTSQVAVLLEAAPGMQSRVADELANHRLTRGVAGRVRAFQPTDLLAGHGEDAIVYSTSVALGLGAVGTTLALAYYLLADPMRSLALLFAMVPRTHHVKMATILSNLELMVGGYMRGQVITSFSMGVFVFLVLSAAGVATPLPLAVFAALADVLPFVGGLLALTPAVLAALPMGTHVAVMVFGAMVLYQEFENRILVPRIYGKALRLPPAAVVMALLVGGKLIGMVGALIALPVAAGLVMLIEELRVEMPGRSVDADLKKLDERAARVYVARSADATPEEAQAIAAQIAGEALEDPKPAK